MFKNGIEEYNTFKDNFHISDFIDDLIKNENKRVSFNNTKETFQAEQKAWKDKEEENALSIFQNILRQKIRLAKQKVFITS